MMEAGYFNAWLAEERIRLGIDPPPPPLLHEVQCCDVFPLEHTGKGTEGCKGSTITNIPES